MCEFMEYEFMEKVNIDEFMSEVNKLNKALDKVAAKHEFIEKYISAKMALEKAIFRGIDYCKIDKSEEARKLVDALQEALNNILKPETAMEALDMEVANK